MESFVEMFNAVKEYCRQELSATAYDTWIKPLEPYSFNDETATVFVKSNFQKKIILSQYTDLISKAFQEVVGFEVRIDIITEKTLNEPSVTISSEYIKPQVDKQERPAPVPETNSNLDGEYEYTFDTFIVGSSNKFAYAACVSVVNKQDRTYNPLFIYGPSGLGKTHLLMAIQHEFKKISPGKNIIYINGETFTNELISAIANKSTHDFHAKYRSADVLLVDDIQFVAGKESTQEEFFYTFNELYQVGKQIVLTSDRPPKDIKTLEERLRTRFEWGILADISPPDFETRIAIIRRKAELLNIEIPDDVAEFIANKLKNNIRQLEGAVKKLKAYRLLTGSSLSISTAQTVIRDILNDNQPIPVTVERIISEVARTYSVTSEDIRSQKRSSQISVARQSAIYIVREITGMSLSNIGEEFGGRDHATIVYAVQKVEKMMAKDPHYKEIIEDIIKNMKVN